MKISDAVADILTTMHQLSFVVADDLLNYSALARLITPAVEDRVGKKVKKHAVIAACKRFFARTPIVGGGQLASLLKGAKLSLQSDMVEVHVKYSPELHVKLYETRRRIAWQEGEKMLVIVRANVMSIIVASKYLPDLLANFKESEVLFMAKHRALITLYYKQSDFMESFGGIHFWTGRLDSLGIGILQIFSSWGQTSFLVRIEDAPAAVKILSRPFERVRGSVR